MISKVEEDRNWYGIIPKQLRWTVQNVSGNEELWGYMRAC